MKKETKLEKEIKKALKEYFDKDKKSFDYEDIDSFSNHLESEGIIDYSLPMRGNYDGMDYWCQAEGWVQTKGRSLTIIFDTDVRTSFDNRKELIDMLIAREKEWQRIKKVVEKINIP